MNHAETGPTPQQRREPASGTNPTDLIVSDLMLRLPELGKLVMTTENLPGSVQPFRERIEKLQEQFRASPDDPKQHEPRWHEFGVVTHTGRVDEALVGGELRHALRANGLEDGVRSALGETIGDKSKFDLLRISIPFHDLGKFARTFSPTKPGYDWVDFKPDYLGHEKLSGEIMRHNPIVRGALELHGLSPEQIDYVARCAELHFELGHVRQAAKDAGMTYDLAFAGSEAMRTGTEKVFATAPGFEVEIAVYFLIDSLGKLSSRVLETPDGGIRVVPADTAKVAAELPPRDPAGLENGLAIVKALLEDAASNPHRGNTSSPLLAEAVWQQPVNYWVGIRAVELAVEKRR